MCDLRIQDSQFDTRDPSVIFLREVALLHTLDISRGPECERVAHPDVHARATNVRGVHNK